MHRTDRASRIMSDVLTSLQGTDLARARELFFDCPNLCSVTRKLHRYLTPIAMVDGEHLFLRSLVRGLEATQDKKGDDAVRAFLLSLKVTAEDLARVRFSVQDKRGAWLIWDYDRPLSDLMERHGRSVVQVRNRDRAEWLVPPSLFITLLANICTARDLQLARIGADHQAEAAA